MTAIREDGPGHLWVGTRGGLSRLEKTSGRCESYVTRLEDASGTGISDNIVNCVHVDGNGIVWIGTSAGLNRFDRSKGEWRVFAQKDGLSGEIVCGILEDGSGALWVSTDRGLTRFDPGSGTGKSYGSWHGLQGGAFNPGAFVKDAEGLMFFGGTNGLNAFDLGVRSETLTGVAETDALQCLLRGRRLRWIPSAVRPARAQARTNTSGD